MDIQKTKGEHSTVVLTVSLTADEVKSHEAAAIKQLSSEVKIDGFRKGHVPASLIRSRIGEAAIQQECIDLAINDAYVNAIRSEKIAPLDRPNLKVESIDPLKVQFIVPVYPEVKVSSKGLSEFKEKEVKVEEKEIDEAVEMFRKNLSEEREVSRGIEKGDIAEINFDGKNAEGVSQPGMQSEFHLLEVGSGTFIPGFEDELLNMKKDEEKTFPITFPADYHAADYAGKEFFFTVKILAVKEKVLPEVDDAFVKKLTGKDETVADLRNEIKIHLEKKKKNEGYAAAQQALFEAIGENTTADLPLIMIAEEQETIIDNIKMQGLQMGLPWGKYLEATKKTAEEIKEEVKGQAEKTVKSRLGLRKLLDEEKIVIPESEIHDEIFRELSRVSANQRKEKERYYAKNQEGWFQIENRLQIRAFFKKMLSE